MDRNEFILATALLLFGAFCVGFLTHWVITRLSRVSKSELGELDSMAEALHNAEEARDAARSEVHTLETRMQSRLAQSEAELSAAMDGLQSARQEADELKVFISEQNMGR